MRRGQFRSARGLDAVASEIVQRSGAEEIWVGVLARHPNADGEIGSGKEFVVPSRVLWADCDSQRSLQKLREFGARPHLVVRSGGGAHAYWLLDEEIDPRWLRGANLRLAHALGADPNATDAARILRPPGTWNMKYEEPRPVVLAFAGQHSTFRARDVVGSLPDPPGRSPRHQRGPQLDASKDPLRGVAPPVYFGEIAGVDVPAQGGMIRCPLPQHEDPNPSCQVFASAQRGWHCYGCGRGGSIYDLAAPIWGLETRGRDFVELRRRLQQRFGLRERASSQRTEPGASPSGGAVRAPSASAKPPTTPSPAASAVVEHRARASADGIPASPEVRSHAARMPAGRDSASAQVEFAPVLPADHPTSDGEGRLSAGDAVASGAILSSGPLHGLLAVGFALLPLFGLVLLFVAVFGAGQPQTGSAGGYNPSAYARRDIPPTYLRIYRATGGKWRLDWTILAAIGKIETDHGRLNAPGVKSGVNSFGCCAGPMQFYVVGANSTWDAYGVDGNRDGRKDVYDPHDAIPAAAKYLRASGAPRDYKRAIFAYNHADWYVRDVLAQAERYRGSYVRDDEWEGGAGRLSWPVRGPITSPFCERRSWEACHPGIDIGVASGTPIHAAAGGRVALMGAYGGYGNYTCIQHKARLSTCYAHQSAFRTRQGARVSRGQVIGLVGCTGLCFGSHLHFEVRLGGPGATVADPMKYLKGDR